MTDEEGEYRRTIGKRVRVERVWRDLTQEQLAKKAGVTRNFISAIERGDQGLDAFRLGRIAGALGLRLAELLGEESR